MPTLKVTNRFKSGGNLAKHFDRVVHCYVVKHRDLVRADGTRNMGNGIAGYFWRGYDRCMSPCRWDGARDTYAYASYRAGEEVAKAESKQREENALRHAHRTSSQVMRANGN